MNTGRISKQMLSTKRVNIGHAMKRQEGEELNANTCVHALMRLL